MLDRLPREAYFQNDWHDREIGQLFSSSWQFVCLQFDLPEPGDYLANQLGNFPIFVLRQKSGEITAFHNVCRHRGATLLEGKGNTGNSIVCPYHRWSYVQDGRLKGAPHMKTCFPDIERSNLSLKPAAIGVFRDLVFVNPDPDADFEQFIGNIKPKSWPHDLQAKDVSEAPILNYELKCNWKIFIENAVDGYHLAYLHENTLGGPEVSENLWEKIEDHMIWYATDEDDHRHSLPLKNRNEAKSWWASKIKSADSIGYGGVYFLFPNTLITATPYSFSISKITPTSPTTSDLYVRHFGKKGETKDHRKHIPGYNKKTDIISSEFWNVHPLETGDFQTEDVWICEKVQLGMRSPAFEPGPLSKGAGAEDPIKWFQASILGRTNS